MQRNMKLIYADSKLSEKHESNLNFHYRNNFIASPNKYWLEDSSKICVFCGEDQDGIEHCIKECVEVSEWFGR